MPYREQDAYDQELFVMADKEENCYESICDQLLNDRMAMYVDKNREEHTVYLDKILDDYAEAIDAGMNTKDVIEAEARRIAESIF